MFLAACHLRLTVHVIEEETYWVHVVSSFMALPNRPFFHKCRTTGPINWFFWHGIWRSHGGHSWDPNKSERKDSRQARSPSISLLVNLFIFRVRRVVVYRLGLGSPSAFLPPSYINQELFHETLSLLIWEAGLGPLAGDGRSTATLGWGTVCGPTNTPMIPDAHYLQVPHTLLAKVQLPSFYPCLLVSV